MTDFDSNRQRLAVTDKELVEKFKSLVYESQLLKFRDVDKVKLADFVVLHEYRLLALLRNGLDRTAFEPKTWTI